MIVNVNPAEILDALKNCADPNAIDKLLPNWPQSLKDVEVPNELLQIFNDAAAVNPPPVLDIPCGHTEKGRTMFKNAMENMWQHYFLDCTVEYKRSGNCEYTVGIKITWPISMDNAILNTENYMNFFMKCIKTRFDADFTDFSKASGLSFGYYLIKDTDSSTKKVPEKHMEIKVISKHCIDPGQETESESEPEVDWEENEKKVADLFDSIAAIMKK